jgi:hypothetical protein
MLPEWLSDVALKIAPVPCSLDFPTAQGVFWQAAPGRFLLDVPGIARYLVEGGHAITIAPASGADDNTIAQFLRMTPLAALLYQRGRLAFHTAAVAIRQEAVLLAGDSGMGKSALLVALLARGGTLLADDLAAVDVDETGRWCVWPTGSEVALWQDTMEKLDIPSTGDTGRQIFSFPDRFAGGPLPLRKIYWLSLHPGDTVEESEVKGLACFHAVAGALTYHGHIADALLDRAAYFRRAATLARSIPLHKLQRPGGRWSVPEWADRICMGEP